MILRFTILGLIFLMFITNSAYACHEPERYGPYSGWDAAKAACEAFKGRTCNIYTSNVQVYGMCGYNNEGVALRGYAHGTCDPGDKWIFCNACPSGSVEVDGRCDYWHDRKQDSCGVGNPIVPSTGNKYQQQTVFNSNGKFIIDFQLYYRSTGLVAFPNAVDIPIDVENLGKKWRHSYNRSIKMNLNNTAVVHRPDGSGFYFNLENNIATPEAGVTSHLDMRIDQNGQQIGWRYIIENDLIEDYDIQGRLISMINRQGLHQNFDYDHDGRLTVITGPFGDRIEIQYDLLGKIAMLKDHADREYYFDYDAHDNLISLIYPDETPNDLLDNPARQYLYEDTRFPHALTGITDENGNRYATWSYDSEGRAISSEHANGVDKTTLTYNSDGTTTVTNPLGKQTTYHFTTIQGVRKVTQVEGHPTASCEGANKSYQYDANGNVISKTDWNGVTTTYTYDLSRNLELSRTEAVGTLQERIITTEWHPQFRLPTRIAEPDRITEYTYDAQGRQLSSKTSGTK